MDHESQTGTTPDWPEFLCTLEPVRPGMPSDPTPEEGEAVAAHFAYYESLLASGTLILAGRTLNEPCRGLFVFRASDQSAAEAIIANDPAVIRGVMRTSLQPFLTALIESR
ncbi:MAG: YciI family protein [Phycisphaerales bacterium]